MCVRVFNHWFNLQNWFIKICFIKFTQKCQLWKSFVVMKICDLKMLAGNALTRRFIILFIYTKSSYYYPKNMFFLNLLFGNIIFWLWWCDIFKDTTNFDTRDQKRLPCFYISVMNVSICEVKDQKFMFHIKYNIKY